jgi:hypothetical protein
MAKVLVFEGNGDGTSGIFGHVIGTDYTFQITTAGLDTGFNSISQAGTGFVFGGIGGLGENDPLVFSSGSGASVLATDDNGVSIYEARSFSRLGDQSVFIANSTNAPFAGTELVSDFRTVG